MDLKTIMKRAGNVDLPRRPWKRYVSKTLMISIALSVLVTSPKLLNCSKKKMSFFPTTKTLSCIGSLSSSPSSSFQVLPQVSICIHIYIIYCSMMMKIDCFFECWVTGFYISVGPVENNSSNPNHTGIYDYTYWFMMYIYVHLFCFELDLAYIYDRFSICSTSREQLI